MCTFFLLTLYYSHLYFTVVFHCIFDTIVNFLPCLTKIRCPSPHRRRESTQQGWHPKLECGPFLVPVPFWIPLQAFPIAWKQNKKTREIGVGNIFLSNFSCMFLNPINFSNLNSNRPKLLDLTNLQEQVKKAFCYQKLFRPFTVWINCSSDLKMFSNSCLQTWNSKVFRDH